MKSVGLRELKARLSLYIRLVRRGQRVQITDRGEVVAEIVPTRPSSLITKYPGLKVLVDEGRLRMGLPHVPGLYPVMPKALKEGSASDLLNEERGDS